MSSRLTDASPESRPSIDGSTVSSSSKDFSMERRKRLGKELCEAAAEGDLAQIRELVESNASPDACDYDKRSAMHLASSEGHIDVVKFLISQNAAIGAVDRWGGYPLMDAVRGKHNDVKELLLQHGAKYSEEDIVKMGQELCLAAHRGQLDKVRELISCGANPNSFDWDRRSALHLASAEGHADIVEELLQHKADPTFKDRWGADPLKDAIRGKHAKVQALLKAAGALGAKDDHSDHGPTMGEKMCTSAAKGDLQMLKLLVGQKGSVNACDYDKRSALHLASAEGHSDVVRFLVEHK
eukprot:CAMPEP_0174936494 /NCGR_PEP_ID=MMETSP1355-20121228/57632_1 /TAXON_ID=464990 /ORGANISM="Hemiselmis tepida, Strain CCMP443" /LENGTH=296 /DNA_ID=CAMNT_0016183275 /DNA_START=1 /DNA_END=888 /DNA_ORIENTATION=+